ncbi:MAG: outer membrane beta-barrel protein [Lacunisphaera sp.]
MTKYSSRMTGWAASALLALVTTASAEIKLNDNFSVSGYIEGSYQYTAPTPGDSTDRLNIDSSQLVFKTEFKPVTGVVSLFYVPNAQQETTLLDAYVTYDAGNGLTVTGGKFLSYLGYESFFTVNNPEISFANGDYLAPIPGYHEGVKVDYSTKAFGVGAALLDSVYSPFYLKGDGELKHNAGFEGYVAYKAIENLTLWAGLAYDTKGSRAIASQAHAVTTLDLWAQYQVDKAVMVAAEYAHKDGGMGATGYNWLTLLQYSFTDKLSTAFRISGEKMSDGGPSFTKYTIAPGVAVTDKLTVRAEYSYSDYKNAAANKANYFGVQAFFKF